MYTYTLNTYTHTYNTRVLTLTIVLLRVALTSILFQQQRRHLGFYSCVYSYVYYILEHMCTIHTTHVYTYTQHTYAHTYNTRVHIHTTHVHWLTQYLFTNYTQHCEWCFYFIFFFKFRGGHILILNDASVNLLYIIFVDNKYLPKIDRRIHPCFNFCFPSISTCCRENFVYNVFL